MKTKMLYVGSLVVFVLCGCQNSDRKVELLPATQSAIVGGNETSPTYAPGRTVAFLVDSSTNMSCTGTIIHERLILTAAHCIGPAKQITMAFGNLPLQGPFDLRRSKDVIVHDEYNKASTDARNDLALILLDQPIPEGFFPVKLPSTSFSLSTNEVFLALGYGRTTGKRSNNPADMQGSGVLRHVGLQIDSVSQDGKQFRVDQSNGTGICNGDSGGPALIRFRNTYYVMGIASATLWTVPRELSGDEKDTYIEQKDFCKEKSIYMNVINYLPWIQEQSQKLLN